MTHLKDTLITISVPVAVTALATVAAVTLVTPYITRRSETSDKTEETPTTPSVCFGDTCIEVEIADASDEIERGLMFRESLGENQGMLFIHANEENTNFWMKNTLIPLDIIWIDSHLQVVHIVSAEPCTTDHCTLYPSTVPAKYTLEVNRSFAEEHSISEGSNVSISL